MGSASRPSASGKGIAFAENVRNLIKHSLFEY